MKVLLLAGATLLSLTSNITQAQQTVQEDPTGSITLESLRKLIRAEEKLSLKGQVISPQVTGQKGQQSLLFKGSTPQGEFVVVPAAAASDLLSKQTNAITFLSDRLAKIEERLEAIEKAGRSK